MQINLVTQFETSLLLLKFDSSPEGAVNLPLELFDDAQLLKK